MGTINKRIHTTLNIEELALVTCSISHYICTLKKRISESEREDIITDLKDKEKFAVKLVNRLGNELGSYPKEDHTKK